MQWKELFLCSAAFFSCTEKQIVHAVQFQWPYCGFWQRHRMTVWHLHCSAKIAPAVSPFAFKMPSLLAFYQPSDSGVTGGQAPSSAGLQWHARHQILWARAGPKGEPSGINKSASAKSMLISCKWSRLNFNKPCQHIHVCSLKSSAAHAGAALQSKKKRKKSGLSPWDRCSHACHAAA